jgi:hypothetical protein
MAIDAFIHPDRMRCISESDASGHSEPYVWPILLWVDDTTIGSGEIVGSSSIPPTPGARIVVKGGIKAGDDIEMPALQQTFAHRFEDGLSLRNIGVVVALFEEDETPDNAVRAAYSAFQSELPLAVADFIRTNLRAPEPAEREAIANVVQPKVEAAGSDALSAFEKFQVFIGSLNLDDQIGFATEFVEVTDNTSSSSFTLQFVDSNNNYEIDGRVELRQTPPQDPCQAQIGRVQAASSLVDSLQATIRSLQEELQDASPSEKPAILREIRRIRQEEIQPAGELEAARQALAAYRG